VDDPAFARAWSSLHRDLAIVDGRLPAHLRNVAMSGWETVAAAHAIVACFPDDPNGAIAAAAASGGDTDTIASIAGAIAGARRGVGALHREWIDGLAARESVDDVLAMILAWRFAVPLWRGENDGRCRLVEKGFRIAEAYGADMTSSVH